MKVILLAGLAVMCAAPAMAEHRVDCPQAYAPAPQEPRAMSADNAAQDTAYRDYVRDTHELGYWRQLKDGWPRVDYDMIYGPGAYHQNNELPGLPK